ncbi:MAG: hypothetical protein U1E05_16010, partial [Patescibacteria group bacterium]|nr:hypothetical protein [Patescibacteria group bacterium]
FRACQPRQFCQLKPHVAEDVERARYEGFIHGDRAVIAMFRARDERSRSYRPLSVVSAGDAASLSPYCAAMFGVHHPDLLEEYRDESRELNADAAAVDFINLCVDFARNHKQTWLDANSFGLSTVQISMRSVEPTIVLVEDVVADLSLFWNKRMLNDRSDAAWIIPVPADQIDKHEIIDSLKQWLNEFDPIANYCIVTSESVSKETCIAFAEQLKGALAGTSIRYVDYEPPPNRLPLVIPVESQVTRPVSVDGRKVQLLPPMPETFQSISNSEYWFVDLLHDARTRRALLEMQLPSSVIIPDILNGPCPPTSEHSVIRRYADGVDSINVRCNSSKVVVDFYVPSPEEVLEELLWEGGYEPVHDEKRSSYLPTIERFGGLYKAAKAFAGKSGEILQTLHDRGTLLPNQIRGQCGLGRGELPIDDYLGRVQRSLRNDSERTKRVARRRFAEFAHDEIPKSLMLGALLEHWADRTILTRRWQLGPCSRCRQTRFVEELSIQQPILCQNCGHRMLLPERSCIAYSLAPPVKHAMDEGIVPVVLAGRFLRNMTTRGFFWLPGVKFKRGDVDIIACCDGHPVFVECKTLAGMPDKADVWGTVVDQFLDLAEVAIRCRASLVVLACKIQRYSDEVHQQIDGRLKNRIPYLLLDRNDLENGHRKVEERGWLSLSDVMPVVFPEARIDREGEAREIRFGAMTHTKGR